MSVFVNVLVLCFLRKDPIKKRVNIDMFYEKGLEA